MRGRLIDVDVASAYDQAESANSLLAERPRCEFGKLP